MSDVVRLRAVVTGSVQGVGFRWSARLEAQRLGVTGYARNRADGAVQVEAEGPTGAVDAFVAWLRIGPPSASVANLEVTTVDPVGSVAFEIA
jgi:acylphosphatase